MRTLFLASIAAVAASAPAIAAERNFSVTDFDQVVLAGSADVDVTTGQRASVIASGDAADLAWLDVKVVGSRLVIGLKRGFRGWASRDGLKVRVSVPSLSAATISGSGEMGVDRVVGPFRGRVSGSGEIEVGSVDSSTLDLAISGSGSIEVKGGRCGAASFSTTGSGNIDAAGVHCRTVTASITGSGNIEGYATETAELRVLGSGNIDIAGGARCTNKVTGVGNSRCSWSKGS